MKPGDSLEIPELKPASGAVPISRYPKTLKHGPEDQSGIIEQIPRQPVGSRMILFLKKRGKSDSSSGLAGQQAKSQWDTANEQGGMRFSALWIDGDKAYCFRQWMNPGPSAFSQCTEFPLMSSDQAVLAARIHQVVRLQRELADVLALTNADWRAQQLERIALGDVYPARAEAMDALGKSGAVALPEILQLMDAPPAVLFDGSPVRVLAEAAGKDSGPQLHARLQQDLAYWKAIGPTLTQDWLGQVFTAGSPLSVKFYDVEAVVQELDRERYAPAAQTVAQFRDFWVSQPQLYDSKWGDHDPTHGGTGLDGLHWTVFQMVKACDDFVKHVSSEKPVR